MAAVKKQQVKQKHLLNAVARKLGRAAGTVTKVTHELAESLSALPESVATKVRGAANIGTPAKHLRVGTQRPRKRLRGSAQAQTTKGTATVEKRRSPKKKTLQSKRGNVHIKG